jgi:drug/metabolite transporter (DMT)-like permease
MALMSTASALAAAPAALVLPLPALASWPSILISGAIHVGYNLALVRAYEHGELGQVYPVARGSSPLLVTLGAALVAGEWPGGAAFAGILLVSFGILGLAGNWSKGASRAGIAAAFTTGALIAAYTVTDGIGARLSGAPLSYAAWLFLLDGLPLPLIYILWRGETHSLLRMDAANLKAWFGGIVSLAAYGAVIFAATLAPLGEVSALRETSVVFAALLGRFFLAETLPPARLACCAAVALGAICLGGWS